MKVTKNFILNITPNLGKLEYQLCLILLDLYLTYRKKEFKTSELRKHPLMNSSLDIQLYQVARGIKCIDGLNRFDVHIDHDNTKFEFCEPMFKNIFGGESGEIDPKAFHVIKNFNMIKLYMWFKTWERAGETIVDVNWLKWYLNINVQTKHLNDKYIKMFVATMSMMQHGLHIANLSNCDHSTKFTHIQFKTFSMKGN